MLAHVQERAIVSVLTCLGVKCEKSLNAFNNLDLYGWSWSCCFRKHINYVTESRKISLVIICHDTFEGILVTVM